MKMLNSTNHREIQVKTTLKCHLIPIQVDIQKINVTKGWQKCDEKKTCVHTSAAIIENSIEIPQKEPEK